MSIENEVEAGTGRGGQPVPNPSQARELVAELMARTGLPLVEANKILAQHGAEPFTFGSVEVAKAEKQKLMGDRAFGDRYLAGDHEAVAQMTALNVRIVGSDQ